MVPSCGPRSDAAWLGTPPRAEAEQDERPDPFEGHRAWGRAMVRSDVINRSSQRRKILLRPRSPHQGVDRVVDLAVEIDGSADTLGSLY